MNVTQILKQSQNFSRLQVQLESTENRIFAERGKGKNITKDYGTLIKQFLINRYTGWFYFENKEYFEADAGTENTPKV